MSYYGEQDVICPYYDSQNSISIYCEGMIDSGREYCCLGLVRFRSQPAKKRYMEKYCCTHDYGKCEYARKIEEKYDK